MTAYTIEQLPSFAHLPQLPRLLELVNELDIHLQGNSVQRIYLGSDKSDYVRTLALVTGPGYFWDHRLVEIEPAFTRDPKPPVQLRQLLQERDRLPEPEPEERPTSVTITAEDMRQPWLVQEKLASLMPEYDEEFYGDPRAFRGHPFFGGFRGYPFGGPQHMDHEGFFRGFGHKKPRELFDTEITLDGLIERLEEVQRKAAEWKVPGIALLRAISYQSPQHKSAAGNNYDLRWLTLLCAAVKDGDLLGKFVNAQVHNQDIEDLTAGKITEQELRAKYNILTAEEEEEEELKEMQVNGGVTVIEHKRVELTPGEYDDDQDWIESGDMVEIEKVKFSYEDGKFFADFDVHRGYYPNEGNSLLTAINLSVFKHREDIPEHLQDSYNGGSEYVKRHIKTPDKRYYGIVEWFED